MAAPAGHWGTALRQPRQVKIHDCRSSIESCGPSGNRHLSATQGLRHLGASLPAHELVPNATMVGMLVNPNFPDTDSQRKDVEEAARKFGQQVRAVNAASVDDFDKALASLASTEGRRPAGRY
jgi:hypothetical protein